MTTTPLQSEAWTGEALLARFVIAEALAAALADAGAPGTPAPTDSVAEPPMLVPAWAFLTQPLADVRTADLGLGELPPAATPAAPLAAWLEAPEAARAEALRRVFGLVVCKECPPFETEYIPSRDPNTRAQHMADAAGFCRAFGLCAGGDTPRRYDHASLLIGFIATMFQRLARLELEPDDAHTAERRDIGRRALADFLTDHILWWMPTFARKLELRAGRLAEHTPDPDAADAIRALAGTARLLRAWVAAERLSADLPPSRRIVEPDVMDEPEDDACGTAGCGTCESARPDGTDHPA